MKITAWIKRLYIYEKRHLVDHFTERKINEKTSHLISTLANCRENEKKKKNNKLQSTQNITFYMVSPQSLLIHFHHAKLQSLN